ncbi:hypothetical protein ABK040_002322 [Willaertia magna]
MSSTAQILELGTARAVTGIVTTCIELLCYLGLGILCYNFKNTKIISTRGYIPFFFVFLQICRCIATLFKFCLLTFLNVKFSDIMNCHIQIWFVTPLDVALLVVMSMQFFSYFLQRTLSERKETLAHQIYSHYKHEEHKLARKQHQQNAQNGGGGANTSGVISSSNSITGQSSTDELSHSSSGSSLKEGSTKENNNKNDVTINTKSTLSNSSGNKLSVNNKDGLTPTSPNLDRRSVKNSLKDNNNNMKDDHSSSHGGSQYGENEEDDSDSKSSSSAPSSSQATSSKLSSTAFGISTFSNSSNRSIATIVKKQFFQGILFIASWKVMITAVIIFFYAWYIISFSLLFTVANEECQVEELIMNYIIVGFAAVLGLLVLIVLFFDLYISLKRGLRNEYSHWSTLKHYLTDDDPSKYRTEFLLYFLITFGMFMTIYLIDSLLTRKFTEIDNLDNQNYIIGKTTGNYEQSWKYWVEILVLFCVFRIPLIICTPGLICFYAITRTISMKKVQSVMVDQQHRKDFELKTIIKDGLKKQQQQLNNNTGTNNTNATAIQATNLFEKLKTFEPSKETVELILSHKETLKLFKDFCVKEFSIENILLYLDIQRFKLMKKPSSKKRYRKLKVMVQTYMVPDSPLEINLPKSITEPLKLQVQFYEERYLQSKEKRNNDAALLPQQSICSAIEKALLETMIDSYYRFYYSSPFQRFLKTQEVKSNNTAVRGNDNSNTASHKHDRTSSVDV